MTIGWGVITVGRHPDMKIVPAINSAEDSSVVAAYSRDIHRVEDFAGKHGIPGAYTSLDDFLADSRVDAVFIASPNFLHKDHTCKSAAAGKHVLVEKPMANSVDEGLKMIEACAKHGVRLGVGFQLRHHPGLIKARQLIRDGILGRITMANAQFFFLNQRGVTTRPERNEKTQWWEDPEKIGGSFSLMGMGVHAIDALQFLLDVPVTEVAAITDGQTAQQPLDDTAALSLRFQNETIGTVCCGRFAPDTKNDAAIYGSHGRILLTNALWERCDGTLDVTSESLNLTESYEPDLLTLYRNQIEAFNGAVKGAGEFNASGMDGLSVVQVTSAAIEAASTGKTVKIEPIQIAS
jgi:1,5-anhydro-D-fructose reductase (1,5-anhydro-D-mannitol-forming)